MDTTQEKQIHRKRRSLAFRLVWAVLAVVFAVVLLAVGTVIFLRSSAGDRFLTRHLPGVIEPLLEGVGLFLHYDALEGPLPERLRISGLRLDDMHGTWLTADTVELHLNIWSILRGHIDVTSLEADTVSMPRIPEFPAPETPPPPSEPGPLTLFPSFLTLDAQKVSLRRVDLGPSVVGLPIVPVAPAVPITPVAPITREPGEAGTDRPALPDSPANPAFVSYLTIPVFDAQGSVQLSSNDSEVMLGLYWDEKRLDAHTPDVVIDAEYKGTEAGVIVKGNLLPVAVPYLVAWAREVNWLDILYADIAVSADMPRIPPESGKPFTLDVQGFVRAAPLASAPANLRTQRLNLDGHAVWNGIVWDIGELNLEYADNRYFDRFVASEAETGYSFDDLRAQPAPLLRAGVSGTVNQQSGAFDLETKTELQDSRELLRLASSIYQDRALYDLVASELPSGGVRLTGHGTMDARKNMVGNDADASSSASHEAVSGDAFSTLSRGMSLDAELEFFNMAWPWEEVERLAGSSPTVKARMQTVAPGIFSDASSDTSSGSLWGVRVENLTIRGQNLSATAKGEFELPQENVPPDAPVDGGAMAGNVQPGGNLEVRVVLDDLAALVPGGTGRVEADVSAHGSLFGDEPLMVSVGGGSPKLTLPSGPTREVDGLSFSGGGALFVARDVAASSFGVVVRVGADHVEGAPVSAILSAQGDAGEIEAEVQASLFGLEAQGHATANKRSDAWAVDGTLDATVTDWAMVSGFAGMPIQAETTRLHVEASAGAGQQVRATLHTGEIRLPESGNVRLASLDAEATIEDAFTTPRITARVNGGKGSASGFEWDEVRATANMADATTLAFSAEVAGTIDASAGGSFDLDSTTLTLDTLRVEKEEQGIGLALRAPATVAFADGLVIDKVAFDTMPSGSLEARVRLTPGLVEIETQAQDVPLEIARLFNPSVPDGLVNADISLRGSPQNPQGSFTVDIRDVRMADSEAGNKGVFARTALPNADPGPRGTASSAMPALSAHLEGELRGGALHATARVEAPNVQAATAELNVPLRFGPGTVPVPELAQGGQLSGTLDWKGQIGQLWQFVPLPGSMLTGLALVHADLEGTMQRPVYRAEAYLADGRYEDMVNGFVFEDIALEATYGSDGSSAVRLRAGDGSGGLLAASGGIVSTSGSTSPPRLDVRGVADAFKPMRRDDLEFSLTGDFTVEGALSSPSVTADLVVNEGAYQVIGSLGGTVTTLEVEDAASGASCDIPPPVDNNPAHAKPAEDPEPDDQAAPALAQLQQKTEEAHDDTPKPAETQAGADPQVAAEAQRTRPDGESPASVVASGDGIGRFDVSIRAENRVFVRARGLTSEWRANLRLTGPLNAPLLVGTLEPIRGTFELLTRDFEFEEGRVTFTGPFPPNPLLNLPMVYEGPNLRAIATASGTARQPKIVLSSEPALPQDEIIAQVLFGKNFSQLSRMETLQAAKAAVELAQLASGGLQDVGFLGNLRETLGLEVLRFGSTTTGTAERRAGRDASVRSQADGDQDSVSTLEAGKYVTDDVYVGVEQGTEAGSTAVRVEVDLRPNVSVDGRSGNDSSSFGLNWKKDY